MKIHFTLTLIAAANNSLSIYFCVYSLQFHVSCVNSSLENLQFHEIYQRITWIGMILRLPSRISDIEEWVFKLIKGAVFLRLILVQHWRNEITTVDILSFAFTSVYSARGLGK